MRVDERLRDALRSLAEDDTADAEAWRRIQQRLHHGRGRSVAIALAAAITAGAVAVSLVLVLRPSGDRDSRVATPPGAASLPPEIVALSTDGRLVALASEDGTESRVIADDISVYVGEGQSLQVAPDASVAYFVRATSGACDGRPIPEVVRADLETGAIEGIAAGVHWPALSPDGRFLAYTGVPNCSDAGGAILVLDVRTGWARTFTTQAWDLEAGIGFLAWAPDSRHLLYAPFDAPEGSFPRILDTNGNAPLDTNPTIPNPDGSRVHGYLGATGSLLGTRAPGADEVQELAVVRFDPRSGEIERYLFRVPEACCGQAVASDATGRHVLALGASPAAGIYRWSEGDREPQRLADDVVAAAWSPRSVTNDPPTAAGCGSEFPKQLVIPAGSSGPDSRAVEDAPHSPTSGQLVASWTTPAGDLEVRWPADPPLAAGLPVTVPPAPAPSPGFSSVIPTQPQESSSGRYLNVIVFHFPDQQPACQTFQITVFAQDDASVSETIASILRQPFETDLPLIVNSQTAETAPAVSPCPTPPDVDSPNRGGAVSDGARYPSPAAALAAFLRADVTLPKLGYREFNLPDGTVAYGWQNPGGAWAIVVHVAPADTGWTVTSWESSGC